MQHYYENKNEWAVMMRPGEVISCTSVSIIGRHADNYEDNDENNDDELLVGH